MDDPETAAANRMGAVFGGPAAGLEPALPAGEPIGAEGKGEGLVPGARGWFDKEAWH